MGLPGWEAEGACGAHEVHAAQGAQQLEPVAVGQAQVEHDRRVIERGEGALRLRRRLRHVRIEARLLQARRHQRRERSVVFDDQYSHDSSPHSGFGVTAAQGSRNARGIKLRVIRLPASGPGKNAVRRL